MSELWAGIDAGKGEHHCVVLGGDGRRVLSRRVANDESVLLELIADVLAYAEGDPVTWAIDLNCGGAALVIALLTQAQQHVLYIPGRSVHHASGAYRGDGKSDAKDAFVIADQARMRRDLQPLRRGEQIALDLKILTSRRLDLAADRTRAINRLRATLLEFFPALERAFDYKQSKAALVLLSGYQSPAALRQLGVARLTRWLKNRHVRNAAAVAATAVGAAKAQHTVVPAEPVAAQITARLAEQITTLDSEIAELDTVIEARFHEHRHAQAIVSMPGIGPILGAELIAYTGGDLAVYATADRLAGAAGLAPVPRDSGRISGNLRRPRRYCRRLLRVFYMSAMVAACHHHASKVFYERKRAEGKTHKQAILALARRRLNVLWALIRDNRTFTTEPPTATAKPA